jgi:hypothetical protein
MRTLNRITVLLSDAEKEEAKRRAGLAPLSAWFRSLVSQPGKEKGYEADRPSEDATGTPRVSLEGQRIGARRRRKRAKSDTVHQVSVAFGDKSGKIVLPSPDPSRIADAGNMVIKHTAESDWHSCLCPACAARRKTLGLEIGEVPIKKERFKRK